ncbi:MAG: HAD family phosphatase [Bacteroidia bacterium]|nr:HAD family phosphatase [Bacteroidia bacterium]
MRPTIIFDLGGVILPLNTEATRQKILEYTNKDIKEWMQFGYPHQLIQKFEMGKITEKEFFEELQDLLSFEKDLYYLKEAWNAMLLAIPKENIEFLHHLSKQYRLILLSNTCETHIQCFEEMLQQKHHIESLELLFDKVYYSCRMGLRKPDAKLFQKIVKENNLDLNHTVYFDDTIDHIESAKKLGIKSYLYPSNELLKNTLNNLLNSHNESVLIKATSGQ